MTFDERVLAHRVEKETGARRPTFEVMDGNVLHQVSSCTYRVTSLTRTRTTPKDPNKALGVGLR